MPATSHPRFPTKKSPQGPWGDGFFSVENERKRYVTFIYMYIQKDIHVYIYLYIDIHTCIFFCMHIASCVPCEMFLKNDAKAISEFWDPSCTCCMGVFIEL